jgi:hypothetical protein
MMTDYRVVPPGPGPNPIGRPASASASGHTVARQEVFILPLAECPKVRGSNPGTDKTVPGTRMPGGQTPLKEGARVCRTPAARGVRGHEGGQPRGWSDDEREPTSTCPPGWSVAFRGVSRRMGRATVWHASCGTGHGPAAAWATRRSTSSLVGGKKRGLCGLRWLATRQLIAGGVAAPLVPWRLTQSGAS